MAPWPRSLADEWALGVRAPLSLRHATPSYGASPTHRDGALAKRSTNMSGGAIAGACVGAIIGALLLALCLYPIFARHFLRRKRPSHPLGQPGDAQTEGGAAASGSPMSEQPSGHDLTRRLSSRDSFALHGRTLTQDSSKEFPITPLTSNPAPGEGLDSVGAPGTQPPTRSSTIYDTSQIDAQIASYQMMGHSASYYSADIPTEAFGVPLEAISTVPRRFPHRSSSSGTSFFGSLLNRVRNSKDSAASPTTINTHTDKPIVAGEITESPLQLSQQDNLPDAGNRDPISSPLSTTQSTTTSPPPETPVPPPSSPAPGTISMMAIHPGTTYAEQSFRTNQELLQIKNGQQPQYTQDDPMDTTETDPSTNTLPEQTQDLELSPSLLTQQPTNANDADADMSFAPPQPSYTVSQPGLDPSYGHKYTTSEDLNQTSSEQSTPWHAPPSPGVSLSDTPDTRVTDHSLSPRSDASTSVRISVSPIPTTAPNPTSLKCEECGRIFDQPHKLNHHKRYHERPHVCTLDGCDKRFGTKTHLERHINDKHYKTKKYHCTEPTCPYSRQGGKSFPRKDNWRRHMANIHNHNLLPDPEPFIDDVMMDAPR